MPRLKKDGAYKTADRMLSAVLLATYAQRGYKYQDIADELGMNVHTLRESINGDPKLIQAYSFGLNPLVDKAFAGLKSIIDNPEHKNYWQALQYVLNSSTTYWTDNGKDKSKQIKEHAPVPNASVVRDYLKAAG